MEEKLKAKRWPARLTFKEKRKQLEIGKDDFDFLDSTFIQSRFPYNIKLDENSTWVRRTFWSKQASLDDHAILDHLRGKHWVATFPGALTKYLCLDLDHSPDIEQRLHEVLKAFPGSLVFQSSTSKGLHVYYFLDRKVTIGKLQRLIKRRLDFFGIEIRPGLCEIFPQELRALRLPLGRGSFILDEITLTPLHETVKDGIRILRTKLKYHSVTELFLPKEYFEGVSIYGIPVVYHPFAVDIINNEEIPKVKRSILGPKYLQNKVTNDPMLPLKGKAFKDYIDHVLRFGIETEGTRFEIQCKLIYHFWSTGLSEEMTFEKIRNWYLSFDHNSKDWRSNRDRVLRGLKNDVNCFFRKKKGRTRFQPRSSTPLTTGDIKYIADTNADYRTQSFIFSLLGYAKSNQDKINALPLPKKLITKFKGCTERTYQERINFCQSIGLIELVKGHNRYQRRSRTFKVNYRFKEGKTVLTLEEGLSEIYSRRDIKQKYSPYLVRKMSKLQLF